MGDRIFYVYEHWRPDTGVCFYVGKGKGKRAWDMKKMRNCHHKAITSKLTSLGYCVDVRIIQMNMAEDIAFALEIERIAFYGQENLSNMTSGGDGLKSPSDETRAKISASQKKRYRDNPDAIARMSEQRMGKVATVATREKISLASRGRSHSPETIEKMKVAAKLRGISRITREAQRKAVTGRKRAPFSEETIAKMKIAAKRREEVKRLARESA